MLDMITLAELWITLSEGGNQPDKIVLPGEMTGREKDRYFKCVKLGTMPSKDKDEEPYDYLQRAIDHIDFIETKGW